MALTRSEMTRYQKAREVALKRKAFDWVDKGNVSIQQPGFLVFCGVIAYAWPSWSTSRVIAEATRLYRHPSDNGQNLYVVPRWPHLTPEYISWLWWRVRLVFWWYRYERRLFAASGYPLRHCWKSSNSDGWKHTRDDGCTPYAAIEETDEGY